VIDSTPISLAERFEVIIEHSEHFENACGQSRFMAMRKHLTWYCRNFRGAAEMRAQMTRANNAEQVRKCLMHYAALIEDEFHSDQTAFRDREPAAGAAAASRSESVVFAP
jgi:hypothetical protein